MLAQWLSWCQQHIHSLTDTAMSSGCLASGPASCKWEWELTADGSDIWAFVTHVWEMDGVSGSWLLLDPTMTLTNIWEVSHLYKAIPYLHLSLSLSFNEEEMFLKKWNILLSLVWLELRLGFSWEVQIQEDRYKRKVEMGFIIIFSFLSSFKMF